MTAGHGGRDVSAITEQVQLIQQAEQGDRTVLPAVRQLLDTLPPGTFDAWADMAQIARESLIKCAVGETHLFKQELLVRRLRTMHNELAGPSPSPIEQLLVERIVLCWLHVYYAETVYIQHLSELTVRQAECYQRRISKAHSRYLSALRTLAQVRRLGLPAVQVNIAEQQVNVAQ